MNSLSDIRRSIIKNFIISIFAIFLLIFLWWFYNSNIWYLISSFNIFTEYNSYENDIDTNLALSWKTDTDFLNEYIYNLTSLNTIWDINNKKNNYISKISLLNRDFDLSREKLNNQNWAYYYNLWNINLFEAYFADDLENIQKIAILTEAIENYNTSASLLWDPDDANANKIINNRVVAYSLRLLISAEICIDIFSDIILKFSELLTLIQEIKELLIEQVDELEIWQYELDDSYLIDCIDWLKSSHQESYYNLFDIRYLIEDYKFSAEDMMYNYIENDSYSCAKDSWEIFNSFSSYYQQFNTSLNNYLETYSVLDEVIQQRDEEALRMFCESAEDISEEMEEDNQNLQEWLEWFDDLFWEDRQDWAEQEEPEFDPDWEDLFWEPQRDEIAPNSPNENLRELGDDEQLEIMEEMRNMWDEWIDDMYRLRSEDWYTPRTYIEELFWEFYWLPEDFWNNW